MNTDYDALTSVSAASLKERYRRASIATLCDPAERGITCSENFVHIALSPSRIVPCESFENAAHSVADGTADFFVVAGAYRNVASLIQSPDFLLVEAVIAPMPALVVAGIAEQRPSKIVTLFYQPAVESMIPEVGIDEIEETEPVPSNAVACYAVKNAQSVTACITNVLCADRLGLTIYQTLRPAQLMPWLIFAKKVSTANTNTISQAA